MKTIEQFKEEYIANLDITGNLTKTDIIEQNMNAIDAGVEFAQRWIPVEEELPVFDKTEYPNGNYKVYFVKILTGSMSPIIRYGAAHLVNDKRWSCELDWNVVTHWRPIEYK